MLPTQALVQTRKLLRAAATNGLDAQLDLERDTQSALGKTHMISSPMVLMTRPPYCCTTARRTARHSSIICLAMVSPKLSYRRVLPTTSANSTASVAVGRADADHEVDLALGFRPGKPPYLQAPEAREPRAHHALNGPPGALREVGGAGQQRRVDEVRAGLEHARPQALLMRPPRQRGKETRKSERTRPWLFSCVLPGSVPVMLAEQVTLVVVAAVAQ